jgi:hypothetical protein
LTPSGGLKLGGAFTAWGIRANAILVVPIPP